MALFNVLVGAALLLFGRRLFWLFVAGVGFVVGAALATQWFGGQSDWMVLLIALAFGVIGALLSVVLQRLVVALAGFLAGGYVLYTLALELQHEPLAWIAFCLGGVVGAILVTALFDWALIVLSALTGATVIAQNVSLDRSASALLFIVLLVLGVAVQAKGLTRKAPGPKQGKPDES
jgi:drug/metabolite transporter (DMT)-like permease